MMIVNCSFKCLPYGVRFINSFSIYTLISTQHSIVENETVQQKASVSLEEDINIVQLTMINKETSNLSEYTVVLSERTISGYHNFVSI